MAALRSLPAVTLAVLDLNHSLASKLVPFHASMNGPANIDATRFQRVAVVQQNGYPKCQHVANQALSFRLVG